MTEDTKRLINKMTLWGSWAIASLVVVLQVAKVIDRPYGIVAVLFIGIAVAAGQASLRRKLHASIVGAFEVGMRAAEISASQREGRQMNREQATADTDLMHHGKLMEHRIITEDQQEREHTTEGKA